MKQLNEYGISIFHFAFHKTIGWTELARGFWEAKAEMTQNWYWVEVPEAGLRKASDGRLTTTAMLIFRKRKEQPPVDPETLDFREMFIEEHKNQKEKMTLLSDGEDGFYLTKADWKQAETVSLFATCLKFAHLCGSFPRFMDERQISEMKDSA